MSLFEKRRVDLFFLALGIIVASTVVNVVAEDQDCSNEDLVRCTLLCYEEKIPGKCIREGDKLTCLCKQNVGGSQWYMDEDGEKIEEEYYCTKTVDENGVCKKFTGIPDTYELYGCIYSVQSLDDPENYFEDKKNYFGCKAPSDLESRPRPRTKFPPILALLLKALKQVRSKFPAGRP